MTDLILISVELGLLYAFITLGIFLTLRILNFPDMTVDGSLVSGAAISAIIIKAGFPGFTALLAGFIAGFIAGSLTSILHIRLGIGKILAGILSLSMLYTINLRFMNGPNISLLNQEHIITFFKTPINNFYTIIFLFFTVLIFKIFIDWFLHTEIGLQLRATGDNESTARSFAINTKITKFYGISLSNGVVGFAGALIAQYQGFADINMGIGTIILGIAALMLGESLILKSEIRTLTVLLIIGSILYQLIINLALRLGLAGTDLKFVTALIVVIAFVLGGNKKRLFYGK